ncbi:uncharacterized protein LOC118438956 isoform X2 [Folsomia candida]|uniref:Uncharacterized protein n=1 Tax=Folsomia candida TaxID=158441 RepID=A0A226D880_FOLCA|nr:uncharacterized protein LOC118438956 isoform X2 [Folsomia candida]OXA41752.1 hypothetical protein Fcan01_23349 [Folsomia candida]
MSVSPPVVKWRRVVPFNEGSDSEGESTEITPEPCPSPVVVDEIVVDESGPSAAVVEVIDIESDFEESDSEKEESDDEGDEEDEDFVVKEKEDDESFDFHSGEEEEVDDQIETKSDHGLEDSDDDFIQTSRTPAESSSSGSVEIKGSSRQDVEHRMVASYFDVGWSLLTPARKTEYSRLAKDRSRHVKNTPHIPWVAKSKSWTPTSYNFHSNDEDRRAAKRETVNKSRRREPGPNSKYGSLEEKEAAIREQHTKYRYREPGPNSKYGSLEEKEAAIREQSKLRMSRFRNNQRILGEVNRPRNRPGDQPSQTLLTYLSLDPNKRFLDSSINIAVHNITQPVLSAMIDYASKSDESLKRKYFWNYVCVAVNWKETEDMTTKEVEEFIKDHIGDSTRTLMIYLGLNSLMRRANRYHITSKSSTLNKLKKQGYRIFECAYLDCNLGNVYQVTGRKALEELVMGSAVLMKRVEAFGIHFGKEMNKEKKQQGLRQYFVNTRNEKMSRYDEVSAENMAKDGVRFFDFSATKPTPASRPDYLFAGNLVFHLLKEMFV